MICESKLSLPEVFTFGTFKEGCSLIPALRCPFYILDHPNGIHVSTVQVLSNSRKCKQANLYNSYNIIQVVFNSPGSKIIIVFS